MLLGLFGIAADLPLACQRENPAFDPGDPVRRGNGDGDSARDLTMARVLQQRLSGERCRSRASTHSGCSSRWSSFQALDAKADELETENARLHAALIELEERLDKLEK